MRPGRGARWAFLSFVVAVVFGACTAPPPAPPVVAPAPPVVAPAPSVIAPAPPVVAQAPVPDDMRQVSELIATYSRVAAMRPDDQRREFAAAGQALTRDPSAYNRIRVGMLAAMPGTAFQDDVRALSLLEPYASAGPEHDRVLQFGAMWHASLAERAKARTRADQLKEQLDALRAVERTIIERGQPAPAAPKR